MTKSELIARFFEEFPNQSAKDLEFGVKSILDLMADSLASGHRIEIRGFGSFSLRFRSAREGRNPKTGIKVQLTPKYVPHFKPGKEMRDRVNANRETHPIRDDSAQNEELED